MAEEGAVLTRASALHALAYCERLFYLEEVEEIRLADESVYAGRTLHEDLTAPDPSGTEWRSFYLSSDRLGLVGRLDAARQRDGAWIPYEHKRGRSRRSEAGEPEAWASDQLQLTAYALLLEEEVGKPVLEGRIRYHAENTTVRVPMDDQTRLVLSRAMDRARELRSRVERPPITNNSNLCLRCSLAPVCLPEEGRLSRDPDWEPIRLFPPYSEGQVVHVMTPGTQVQRSGRTLVVSPREGAKMTFPIQQVTSVVLHGNVQMTTQALHLCAGEGVPVHWLSGGGRYLAGMASGAGHVHRRLRQFQALSDPGTCLRLARRLASARIESQLRYLLRATRGTRERGPDFRESIGIIRSQLRAVASSEGVETVRGHEGAAGRAYFERLPDLLSSSVAQDLRPSGRSRRPPRDRFNALLSFGYALLYSAVLHAIMAVGLEPALGFFHTPRSAAPPLVLDIMELFRVPVWDMTVIGSLNRRHWDARADFDVAKDHVWLSDQGRRKAVRLFQDRLEETWKHPVTDYSLSYGRTIELEARLLEKEWTGEPGLFARARIR
ncbi:MAG: type I-MYXAN CRISPR-associated endonuclease Cas1 [Chloroflexota bacterium]|nr:MAG: type I-MYXAN CRISPR-associated endonuclease Cas1 [Chloroflexota bacterium]